jgi:SAM-dependent methyltransferase
MQHGLLDRMLEVEEKHWWFSARRELLLALLRHWVPSGRRLLDVGCGTGFLLGAAREDWEVWGLDPAPEAVEFCHARGLTHVVQGTVSDLGTGKFPAADAICFFDVLEHLVDDVGALRGAASNLAADGLVLATVPAYRWLWTAHDTEHHHFRRYTTDRLGAAFREAGLAPLQLGYFNTRLFPLALAARMIDRIRGHQSSGRLLPVPAAPINKTLRRIFASERNRLAGPKPRPFRYGLSVVAVGRKS